MKRTLMFMCMVAALLCGGCSSAQAACPGGRCASVGVWSPWGGVWYYQSPCAGGRCAAKKAAAAPEVAEEAEPQDAPAVAALPSVCEIVSTLVNDQRKTLGLPALAVDPALCDGAARHSAFMRNGGGFQHGYYSGTRECIAYGVTTPQAVVRLWLNSSGHRAILLGAGKTIGVGRSGSYWTLRVR